MARKATKKASKATAGINEGALTKGELRKLTALRKSLGSSIADKAFTQWMKRQVKGGPAVARDKNADMISEAIGELVTSGKCRIPRGGYLVNRGRGRVIVTRAKA